MASISIKAPTQPTAASSLLHCSVTQKLYHSTPIPTYLPTPLHTCCTHAVNSELLKLFSKKNLGFFWGDLFLDYRVRFLKGNNWIPVTMHKPPGSVFKPKNACSAQNHLGHVFHSADFGFVPLYLYDVSQVVGCVLHHVFEAGNLPAF